MAAEGESHRMVPAVVTLRPDNFLTIGLIVLISYTIAVFVTQLAMRVTARGASAAPIA
jgi:hypothetical protein